MFTRIYHQSFCYWKRMCRMHEINIFFLCKYVCKNITPTSWNSSETHKSVNEIPKLVVGMLSNRQIQSALIYQQQLSLRSLAIWNSSITF